MSQVGSDRVGLGRVGSGRVGSGRVGSGRVKRFSNIGYSNLAGRVRLGEYNRTCHGRGGTSSFGLNEVFYEFQN